MSSGQIALLGAIAGITIFLGLPLGRLRTPLPKVRAFLNATAIGILIFLLWDVLKNGWAPDDGALGAHHYADAFLYGGVMLACVAVGLLSLVHFEGWLKRRTAGMAEQDAPARAVQLSLLIAVGIGLHNFGEGLAIGNSAATGKIALATLLVVGFGAHNATEGFGIVAPLSAAGSVPSWGRLALLGVIGGGPTFLGTLVGQQVTNPVLGVAFLALAAGSILYVVMELLAVARAFAAKPLVARAIFLGLSLGFITDGIISAAGT